MLRRHFSSKRGACSIGCIAPAPACLLEGKSVLGFMRHTFLSLFFGSMPYTALRNTDVGSLACSSFAGRSLRPPGNLDRVRGLNRLLPPPLLLACAPMESPGLLQIVMQHFQAVEANRERSPSVPSIQLLIPLLSCEFNMPSVLYYHNIALVPFRRVGGLVLSLHMTTLSGPCLTAPNSSWHRGAWGVDIRPNARH